MLQAMARILNEPEPIRQWEGLETRITDKARSLVVDVADGIPLFVPQLAQQYGLPIAPV
jgi:hypothetical protein